MLSQWTAETCLCHSSFVFIPKQRGLKKQFHYVFCKLNSLAQTAWAKKTVWANIVCPVCAAVAIKTHLKCWRTAIVCPGIVWCTQSCTSEWIEVNRVPYCTLNWDALSLCHCTCSFQTFVGFSVALPLYFLTKAFTFIRGCMRSPIIAAIGQSCKMPQQKYSPVIITMLTDKGKYATEHFNIKSSFSVFTLVSCKLWIEWEDLRDKSESLTNWDQRLSFFLS